MKKLKPTLWHVCHYSTALFRCVTEVVLATSREDALKKVLGHIPHPSTPLVVWPEKA